MRVCQWSLPALHFSEAGGRSVGWQRRAIRESGPFPPAQAPNHRIFLQWFEGKVGQNSPHKGDPPRGLRGQLEPNYNYNKNRTDVMDERQAPGSTRRQPDCLREP